MDASIPRSKRLLSDERSNIFIYMTGHGGNEFLKFQDNEEISAFDIADAFEQMYQKKRYSNKSLETPRPCMTTFPHTTLTVTGIGLGITRYSS